ncbi:MAG: hypothetical protein QW548_00840 [Candidatus Aenigmatarchaeota archaeon]
MTAKSSEPRVVPLSQSEEYERLAYAEKLLLNAGDFELLRSGAAAAANGPSHADPAYNRVVSDLIAVHSRAVGREYKEAAARLLRKMVPESYLRMRGAADLLDAASK